MIEHIEQYGRHVSGHYRVGKTSPSWLKLWKRKNWSVTIEMLNSKRRRRSGKGKQRIKKKNRLLERETERKQMGKKDAMKKQKDKEGKERLKEKKKERKERPKLIKFKIKPK